jgi:hypothetical protein
MLLRDLSTLETDDQEAFKRFKVEWKKSIQKIWRGQQNYQQLKNSTANQLGGDATKDKYF